MSQDRMCQNMMIQQQIPNDFRVKEIVLYGYNGSQLDITGLTALVNIYQDLDTPFISGNIMFYDSIGATNKLPIINNEFLEFKMRTPIDGANGDEEINATNHRFQVYEKKSVKTSQIQTIALFFTSIESIRNERLSVSKSLSGSYAEMVNKHI